MATVILTNQSHNAMSVLANNVDWNRVNSRLLQEIIDDPRKAGEQFALFLRNGGRVIIGESKIIQIDRSEKFNSTNFLNPSWNIVEQDDRSLALTELDLTAVVFKHLLEPGEKDLKYDEKINRLKETGYVRLDAGILQILWENQYLIPECWKKNGRDGRPTHISFDGTVFRNSCGPCFVLNIYWLGGSWNRGLCWYGQECSPRHRSAVLIG